MSGTGRRDGQAFVGEYHFAVVPSDSVNFAIPASGGQPAKQIDASVVVWGAGNVSAVDVMGNTLVWPVTVVPYTIPMRLRRVNATGTTATNMIGVS